jgi:hypothetical protein
MQQQYQVKISNRLSALENLDDNLDINRAWKNVIENIKFLVKVSLGYYKVIIIIMLSGM